VVGDEPHKALQKLAPRERVQAGHRLVKDQQVRSFGDGQRQCQLSTLNTRVHGSGRYRRSGGGLVPGFSPGPACGGGPPGPGPGGMVDSVGACAGQTSRTAQGAWSTTNRVCGPRLRGPSALRSPLRAGTSSRALAAAATTSRSTRPVRWARRAGRPRAVDKAGQTLSISTEPRTCVGPVPVACPYGRRRGAETRCEDSRWRRSLKSGRPRKTGEADIAVQVTAQLRPAVPARPDCCRIKDHACRVGRRPLPTRRSLANAKRGRSQGRPRTPEPDHLHAAAQHDSPTYQALRVGSAHHRYERHG